MNNSNQENKKRIIDEPTEYLDPITEEDIKRYEENKKNKPQVVETKIDGLKQIVNPNQQKITPVSQPVQAKPEVKKDVINTNNDNAYINEHLKEVEIEDTKDNKGKYVLTVLLFVILGSVIIFMPEISEYLAALEYKRANKLVPKITTGDLVCEREENTDTLDMKYTYKFNFSDNKLNKLYFTTDVLGDLSLDSEKLEKYESNCKMLDGYTKELTGIEVSCELVNGKFKKKEILDYSGIKKDEALTAFTEAGGIYPNYNYRQEIDSIESELKTAGYSCKRIN